VLSDLLARVEANHQAGREMAPWLAVGEEDWFATEIRPLPAVHLDQGRRRITREDQTVKELTPPARGLAIGWAPWPAMSERLQLERQ
jgi:hypothetical protein